MSTQEKLVMICREGIDRAGIEAIRASHSARRAMWMSIGAYILSIASLVAAYRVWQHARAMEEAFNGQVAQKEKQHGDVQPDQ